MRADIVAKRLQSQFPGIRNIHARDDRTIILGNAAEGGTIDGMDAALYYGEYGLDDMYIDPRLERAVKSYGYFTEWYDPGTLMAYKD